MSTHLKKDLESLERRLLVLAGRVEEAVRRSISALVERRTDLAERVIQGDREIDRSEVELEEECLKVLALHQPVATDLRFVAACLKIDNDLERIGDLASNIAERTISLLTASTIRVPARIADMMEMAAGMVRDSIDAFVRGDAEAARQICEDDDMVDEQNRVILKGLLERMHEDPSSIDQLTQLFSISKNLERIADHATNIAEDVIYLVEGEIIRHQLHRQQGA